MTDYWKLTPLEYTVGWRAFGWDRLHFPLQEEPTALLHEEYNRQCEEAAKAFAEHWGDDLYGVFVTLAAPTARLHAFGRVGAGDARKVRLYAGIRHQAGAVAAQEPGGTIHIYRVPTATVGQRVAQALPSMGPGHRAGIEVAVTDLKPRADSDFGTPTSWMSPVYERPTVKQEWDRFTSAPRVGVGQIEIYPGPTLGARDTGGRREVNWLDLVSDGRYLVTETRRTATIRPVDARALGEHLQQLLEQAALSHARNNAATSR